MQTVKTVQSTYIHRRANGLEVVVKDVDNISLPVGTTITVRCTGMSATGRLKDPVFWRLKDEITIEPHQVHE